MIWFVFILASITAIILLLYFSSLVVVLEYVHQQDDDRLTIQIRLWRIIKHTVRIPAIKAETEKPGIEFMHVTKNDRDERKITADVVEQRVKDIKKVVEHVVGLKTITGKFINSILLKKFEWHTVIGMHDAAWTGIAAGGIWAAKGGILNLITSCLRVGEEPLISVTPVFQKPFSQTHLTCMFKFQIGKAILTGFKILKYWRGGKVSIDPEPISDQQA
ncbi:DUF2953 domain-containing protein [Heyndrickxia acidiproducens]|uniref:DUF2953 domain-containing protein n=1 Tax=Heyndrickxia acidiproducens TaxID=1121084 RepID=UPI000369F715|nr:DUF2953 domain-containing protein [Heyndrickxia acidiproducens]